MKIWAKVMVKDKIRKDVVLDFEDTKSFTFLQFKQLMQDLCYKVDISTPVILKSHYEHFTQFNRVKFLPRDFIEQVDYTSLVVEVGYDKKKATFSTFGF